MKLLIVTQHFPPERGAVRRLYEFARYFAQQGHEVSVLTAIPNYPDGVIPPKYRGSFFYREEMEGVKVYRTWVLAASNRYPGKRMVGFITFFLTSLINSLRIRTKFDLVLASTPPVTTPFLGWLLAKMRRAKLVIEIRDLQPESAEDYGNLNRSFFTRTLKKMMHWLYKRADLVVPVTNGIGEYLKVIGVEPNRVATIKSGFSSEFVTAGMNGIRRKFGWEEKFLVLYAGTLGWAHALETVIEAARQLNDQPDICFVFVGDGQKRELLEGMVRDYGLKNVAFVGTQPLETIPYFLKASDVLLHSLKDAPVTKGGVPSKLYEYMASGRPIVFGSSDGEAIIELDNAGGALAFPPEEPTKLCELILKLRSKQIDGDRLGENYLSYANENHRREIWARKYLDLLEQV
uniref:Group 1 glycosyl transferase n=1 Tax=uncultured bacterium pAW1 TaxID=1781155 RepID=A0A1C9U4Q7_9BACT|nr:group 1 glycosyl transferase [uncultured bacterium pAW1]